MSEANDTICESYQQVPSDKTDIKSPPIYIYDELFIIGSFWKIFGKIMKFWQKFEFVFIFFYFLEIFGKISLLMVGYSSVSH